MARPRRPAAEIEAVSMAAEIVRRETRFRNSQAVSREIARQVVDRLIVELEGDPLELAFAHVERNLIESPFYVLAECPEINTLAEFVDRRVKKLRGRNGRYLSPPAQVSERNTVLAELRNLLTLRYDRHLRSRK